MSTEVIVYVLTALAALVLVLTRLRLGRDEGHAGRLHIPSGLLNVHTGVGAVALVLWLLFLVAGDSFSDNTAGILGVVALALWWVVVVAGLLILVRWLPTRGRHAAEGREDSWSDGPGLSILAHVGMFVGVAVFTWAYLINAV